MAETPETRASTSVTMALGPALITLGILLTLIGSLLDGFPHGLFQGAGVALILLGVVTVSTAFRRRSGGGARPADAAWLPSRDGDR